MDIPTLVLLLAVTLSFLQYVLGYIAVYARMETIGRPLPRCVVISLAWPVVPLVFLYQNTYLYNSCYENSVKGLREWLRIV